MKSRPREETALSVYKETFYGKQDQCLCTTRHVKLHGYLQRLHDDNNIMLDGDEVYFI